MSSLQAARAPPPPPPMSKQQASQQQPQQPQQQQSQQQRRPRRRVFAINPPGGGNSSSNSLWSRLFQFQFQFRHGRMAEMCVDGIQTMLESFVYLLGPVLICLALGIAALLTNGFFTIVFPMMQEKHASKSVYMRTLILGWHCSVVFFILFNVLFNYFLCVMTSNSCLASKNPVYHAVVRELAQVTGFIYPETPAQVQTFRRDYEDMIVLRMRRRRARDAHARSQAAVAASSASTSSTQQQQSSSDAVTRRKNTTTAPQQQQESSSAKNGAATTTSPASPRQQQSPQTTTATSQQQQPVPQPPPAPIRRWMLTGPFEWGYCANSNLPKPPRSHYDHVTKSLVLNLDHYCPWMFNSIGYFNYRYFVNFMLYIWIGMMYGVVLTLEPFLWLQRPEYHAFRNAERAAGHHLSPRPHPMLPRRDEKMMLTLCFMLCAAVGCAIFMLGGFHVYLVLSAQTTIEFHGNWNARFGSGRGGKKFQNPYNQGWKRNWQQVYGDSLPWYRALLPRKSEPEYLPVPIPGKDTKRQKFRSSESNDMQQPQAAAAETETLLGALESGNAGAVDPLAS